MNMQGAATGIRRDRPIQPNRCVVDIIKTHIVVTRTASPMSFDHVVITAANARQAAGYRAQLDWRIARGVLDADCDYTVVADPGGHRVGSLGATLNVLGLLAEQLGKAEPAADAESQFTGRRILICHSGGDSRRLPAYAAQGKVFAPLPTSHSGIPATLFDLILANAEQLPAPSRGQVLIYVGDVLLTFDPDAVDFDQPGIVGVAYPGSMETGSRHGVYVASDHATQGGCLPVRDFLQKPDEATAADAGAIDPVGRVLIDTGILSFDPPTTAKLLKAAGTANRGLLADLSAGKAPGVDLYEELLMALPPKLTKARYREAVIEGHDATHRRRLERFYDAVSRTKFHVNVLPFCDFFHIGSSREYLTNIATLNRTAQTYGFAPMHNAIAADGATLEGAFAYNTIFGPKVRAAAGTLIEACEIDVPAELPGGNVLVGLPAGGKTPIRLRQDVGLVVLPIGQRDWAAVCFGLTDDFKSIANEDSECGFLNESITDWLARHDVDASKVWPGGATRSLWEAQMWVTGPLPRVLGHAMWMQAGKRNRKQLPGWLRSQRLSMKQLVGRVDHERLIAHRQEIQRQVELAQLSQRLLADDNLPATDALATIANRTEADEAIGQLVEAAEDASPLFTARAMKLAQMIAEQHRLGADRSADYERRAFGAIAESVGQSVDLSAKPTPAAILPDQVVWATTPVRLDFCGGWSDTPPFCTERGGTVVNAAITLNGQYPVQAMAKLNSDHVIRLSSIDLGTTQVIERTEQLLDYTNPADWGALPKAALVLAGLGPNDPKQSLNGWLKKLGGGVDLTIFSALPKGSGLGTSSVLGAAVLACLDRVVGKTAAQEELIARVSLLEQLMTTGGGWQDQVGGVTPGVKLITTQPGVDQTPTLRYTPFNTDSPELADRLLLYYTGQKRLAKNILQNVVGRYLARDPQAVAAIDQLKDAALQMKADLDRADVDAFASGVQLYWQLKKQLDPGATNPGVEKIIRRVDRYCDATCLPGAGGGGFVFMIAKDAEAAARIRRNLTTHPPNKLSRFFDFAIDPTGLKVTTL